MWHCDGMDKLKRFGIAIHGCIDGYNTTTQLKVHGLCTSPTITITDIQEEYCG